MKNNSNKQMYLISSSGNVRKGIVPGLPMHKIPKRNIPESPSALAKKNISLSPFKISYNASMSTS